MAAIPNLESILLAIHAALGCPAPRKKQELKDLKRPFDIHLRELGQLVDDILAEMGLDPGASFDALRNLEEFGHFHKTLEVKTWTLGAEPRQVLWDLLACVYIPGLARRAAFWHLAAPGDPDMPGGDFWYLPQVDPTGEVPRLRMPLSAVLDWLEDLLGQPVHKSARSWPDPTIDTESVKRSLTNWRAGDVPRRENIERYFAEGTSFEFRGCLNIREDASPDHALEEVRSFVDRKGLTADAIRLQIPMSAPGRIESVLGGRGTSDEVARFLALINARYGQPSLRTIRRRLLTARATQHAYVKLHQLLCPETSVHDTDAKRNKVLQLIGIYGGVYNLTLRANAVSDHWPEQDEWFEQRLAPWDRRDLFLSILPSKRLDGALELAEVLTWRFAAAEPGAPLEDWAVADAKDLPSLVQRKKDRVGRELKDIGEYQGLVQALRAGSLSAALGQTESYKAASLIAANPGAEPSARHAAVKRMRELAATPAHVLDAILIEVDLHLNSLLRSAAADTRAVVEQLLKHADENPARSRRLPQLLNAHAKHHLRSNEFDQARLRYDDALQACLSDSCGDLPGLVARDAFALDCAIKPNGFSIGNCERYWRLMLSFAVSPGPDLSLEQVAQQLEAYFSDHLYRPYPGVARWKRP